MDEHLFLLQLIFALQNHPCNENRFFPVKKNYTGKTLFSLQGGFAVYYSTSTNFA
jgi:hypothetical protein